MLEVVEKGNHGLLSAMAVPTQDPSLPSSGITGTGNDMDDCSEMLGGAMRPSAPLDLNVAKALRIVEQHERRQLMLAQQQKQLPGSGGWKKK